MQKRNCFLRFCANSEAIIAPFIIKFRTLDMESPICMLFYWVFVSTDIWTPYINYCAWNTRTHTHAHRTHVHLCICHQGSQLHGKLFSPAHHGITLPYLSQTLVNLEANRKERHISSSHKYKNCLFVCLRFSPIFEQKWEKTLQIPDIKSNKHRVCIRWMVQFLL